MELMAGLGVINSSLPDKATYAGTLGGPVYDHNGALRLLTCFHCIYADGFNWNTRQISPAHATVSVQIGGIFQDAAEVVDVVRDGFVDLALLKPQPGNIINKEIGNWGIPKGSRHLQESEKGITWLKKIGYKSPHVTYARFEGFQPYYGDYYRGERSMFYLHDLIEITAPTVTPFSIPGDSGSFVLDSENNVVGMIVMGQGHTSYAIKASYIEDTFKIKFSL